MAFLRLGAAAGLVDGYLCAGEIPGAGRGPHAAACGRRAVAVLEGALAGAGFGLAVGVLCDAVYFGGHRLSDAGPVSHRLGRGRRLQYVLSRNFGGCLLCAAAGLVLIDMVRVFAGLFTGLASLPALLRVALPEVLWSLCFVCLLYPWFAWVRGRIIHFLRL